MKANLLKSLVLIVGLLASVPQFGVAGDVMLDGNGDGRGGGNVLPSPKIKADKIDFFYKYQIPRILVSLLKTVEEVVESEESLKNMALYLKANNHNADSFLTVDGVQALLEVKKRIFPEGVGIKPYEALGELKFNLLPNGPCHDYPTKNEKGETIYPEVDASAATTDPNEICISLERLTDKLTEENAVVQILALTMHEVIHKLGKYVTVQDDNKPLAVQKLILKLASSKTIERFSDVQLEAYKRWMWLGYDATELAVLASDPDSSLREVCSALKNILEKSLAVRESTIQAGANFGTSLLRPNEARRMFLADVRLTNAMLGSCMGYFLDIPNYKPNEKEKSLLKEVFGDKSETTSEVFGKYIQINFMEKNAYYVPTAGEIIPLIKKGDRKTLAVELAKVRKDFDDVSRSAGSYLRPDLLK